MTEPEIFVGADPEFFIQRGRHFVSAHVIPAGSKKSPLETMNGHIQVDGTALECNVRPAKTRADFVRNTRGVIRDMEDFVAVFDKSMKLVARPSVYFGNTKLRRMPQEAQLLGCEPDFDAYEEAVKPRPNHQLPFRTGAGHVHVGWTSGQNVRSKGYIAFCAKIVRQLDFYLGLPSIVWDTDQRRRRMYGQAGAFRPKPYGLEYRVLSNKWLENDNHVGWVFDQTVRAVRDALSNKLLETVWGPLARPYINNGDTSWMVNYPSVKHTVMQ